ncbi:MAG: flagellar biosynthesis protein FliQ [Spirochaetaceae bacterium]|nr:flagellar biosynthesis protein FliQ [Spirochaetaceae bacterium]RKX83419.1 MAG: flagellar biosynthetic protein FliQ [Spirochaetota bacterium]
MSVGFASMIMRGGIFQILIMAAPVLMIGMTVGLIISIFQATTSIQEQTLTFVPKIIAIFLTLAFFGPWMFSSMREFTLNIFRMIPNMTG